MIPSQQPYIQLTPSSSSLIVSTYDLILLHGINMDASVSLNLKQCRPLLKVLNADLINISRNLGPTKVIRYQRPNIHLFQLHKRPVSYHNPPYHTYIFQKNRMLRNRRGREKNSRMRRSLARKATKTIVVKQKRIGPCRSIVIL